MEVSNTINHNPKGISTNSVQQIRKVEVNVSNSTRDVAEVTKEVTQDQWSKLKIENDTQELKFEWHEGTNQVMFKVLDKRTGEIIKEMPSEKILDMVTSMCELNGLFINEKR